MYDVPRRRKCLWIIQLFDNDQPLSGFPPFQYQRAVSDSVTLPIFPKLPYLQAIAAQLRLVSLLG